MDALIADLEQDLILTWGRPVQSIYFGGGTPSLISAEDIAAFLSNVRARLELSPDVEITLEANPGTIEHDSFEAYYQAGINRVSLGVQSTHDDLLDAIGRIHQKTEIENALMSLQSSRITNFNLDLMYALPGQNLSQSACDVDWVIKSGASHVSFYQLTIEPNTRFMASPPIRPDHDAAWEMQQTGQHALENSGFNQYEISAFARHEMKSRHNMNYWRYGDFLAIGAGAHSKITQAANGSTQRFAKHRHPKQYLQGRGTGDWVAEKSTLGQEDHVFGFFVNQLRLKNGVYVDDFVPRTGLAWEVVESRVQQAMEKGLLETCENRLKPTRHGWNFVNDIQQLFLPKGIAI
jgi:oxygen-independent coproporphyrinogen-3 oxidase